MSEIENQTSLVENSLEMRALIEQELRLPQIDGERCVHAHIETASCQACVDICPKQAWVLSDDSLSIRVEACDGCGLCAPACTEGAILHEHEPLLRQYKQHILAFVACEKTAVTDTQAVMPCVHALGLSDIVQMYRHQVRGLVVTTGECEACQRFTEYNLYDLLENVNQLLKQRQLMPLLLRDFPTTTWLKEKAKTEQNQGESLSRRSFFKQTIQNAARETMKAKGWLTENFKPPASRLPEPETDEILTYPFVPQIDAQFCTGCDACINTCPHQALEIDTETAQYVINPKQCTGCRICVDICHVTAIQLEQWQTSSEKSYLDLTTGKCRRCGAPFHYPESNQAQTDICPICKQVNHHSQLFQVYKD